MSKDPDLLFGAVAATSGSLGLYVHLATELASVLVIWGNLALVAGGLYLMWRKLRSRK